MKVLPSARFLEAGVLFERLMRESYRTPANIVEAHVHRQLLARGAVVLRRGWPDFAVIEGDRLYAVEVKSVADKIHPSQGVILSEMARSGIDTYIWRELPSGSIDKITGTFEAVGESERWRA